MRRTWLIDSGHGGMVDGIYLTAPHKMYSFDNGETAYEGVINREIKNRLLQILTSRGVRNVDLCPTQLDLKLSTRVAVANRFHRDYGNCVLISLHSNAGGGEGFEVWTSVGDTPSDPIAELLIHELENSFPSIRMRKDESDDDGDEESNFYILHKTNCPAILPECLFFDNYEDYKKLIDPVFQQQYAQAIANFILRVEITTI